MTYKEFKKAVAEKAGITLGRLEKEIREGYALSTKAADFRLIADARNYRGGIGGNAEDYCADVIEEHIAEDAEDLKAYLA